MNLHETKRVLRTCDVRVLIGFTNLLDGAIFRDKFCLRGKCHCISNTPASQPELLCCDFTSHIQHKTVPDADEPKFTACAH